ncbi:MAG: type I 3-dehydroquinate dehydratase [Chloroflexi bacterium]|nr:type I 3-dehydroquinate dehydratase [Chloroflexota bacterium]
MKKPRICAAIIKDDLSAIRKVEPLVELFEVRIDLIGGGWPNLAKQLRKPWIACNRMSDEGGRWQRDEAGRIEELIRAVELGANIVDIELRTKNLATAIPLIKRRARCLVSLHELKKTPPLNRLKEIVQRELAAGADVCKVITTAQSFKDNLTTLKLIAEFPEVKIVSFAMGPLGFTSRVFCPLVGGYFTYASIGEGKESAPGQITVSHLTKIYQIMSG